MSLRRKLLTTFGALALVSLVIAGVTVWAILRWQSSNERLQDHYTRSLLLQRVRATVFRAFKELPDAVTGGDNDARIEFDAFTPSIEDDFQSWAELADTDEERQQVQQVRAAYDQLVQDARTTFDLVDAGRTDEAFAFLEGQLEDNDFQRFQDLTEQAVESDQQNRQIIRDQVANTQRTAQIVLAVAAFGTLSLVLLLAAYLASDLFAPLRDLQRALDDAARGDFQRRLPTERADEFGAVNQSFNRMVQALEQRAQAVGMTSIVTDGAAQQTGWRNMPSRVMLHTLVGQLRTQITQLNERAATPDGSANGTQALVQQIDQLSLAVARVTDFGFPLDLNLARTDIRALVYEVLLRFHDELVRRGVSLEIEIAPEVQFAVVDRLKVREALGELVRNALKALPEQGGTLGLRARIADDPPVLLLEVADDGRGAEQPLINRAFDDDADDRVPGVGLRLTREIVERHGGKLRIDSVPQQGTFVQIRFPLHED
jgi:two-component system, OmpR family, sensor kinase